MLARDNWTDRTRALFAELDASPQMQAAFVRDPRELLRNTFGGDGDCAGDVSAANRLLFQILRDGSAIEIGADEDGRDAAAAEPQTPYARLLHTVLRRLGERASIGDATALEVLRDFNVASAMDARGVTRLDAELEARLDVRLGVELQAQLESRVEAEALAKLDTRLGVELQAQLESRVEAEALVKLDTRLGVELQAQLESRADAEALAKLDTRLGVELRAQLETRIDAKLLALAELQAAAEAEAAADGVEQESRARGQSASFSRLDLQKLAGFIASRAPAVMAELAPAPGAAS
ncbi:MAG: hypothetical protein JOZ24_12110 [Candidatus Eremiobacteraeota bacterium]|nr:hypothetical protein [Candidatus Eremiobacteraeota bacterium]